MKFIVILLLSLSGDALITTSLVWLVIKAGGDIKMLGLFLFFNTLIIYLGQKFFRIKNNKTWVYKPDVSFKLVRFFGLLSSIGLAILFYYFHGLFILYLSASIFTIINFLSYQYLESYFGFLVFNKKLSAANAAKIQQTTLQLSVLVGAALAGFFLPWKGFFGILCINAMSYLIGIFSLNEMNISTKCNFFGLNGCSTKNIEFMMSSNKVKNFSILIALLISLHVFNFLLPFWVQKDKNWSSFVFGGIDGLSAFGAFLSVFFSRGWLGRCLYKSAGCFIVLSFGSFTFISYPLLALIIGFIYGFSMNALRVMVREALFSSITSIHSASKLGKDIAFINMSLKALTPVFMSFLILHYSSNVLFLIFSIFLFFIFSIIFRPITHVFKSSVVKS